MEAAVEGVLVVGQAIAVTPRSKRLKLEAIRGGVTKTEIWKYMEEGYAP
jgi:hypothetical protein